MGHLVRSTILLLAAFSRMALGQTSDDTLNHSFTVNLATARVCLDGAIFTGEPTQASALNLSMLSQIFDPPFSATVIATGTSHTFTSVGEQFTFVVRYPAGTFPVGEMVGVSASDIPGTLNGAQGFIGQAAVANCFLFDEVPTLSPTGLTLAVLLLIGVGFVTLRRRIWS